MSLQDVFWAAGFIGHVALLLVLLLRRRWRAFPVFTSLIAYQALVTVVLFFCYRYAGHRASFLAFWISAFGDYLFQIALIFELARNVLRPVGTWIRDARTGFLVWSAIGCLAAAAVALTIGSPGAKGLDLWEARVSLFTSMLTCEVFLAMSAAANRLGLAWRTHVMSLGQGLTAWAAAALLTDFGHVALGWSPQFAVLDQARQFVYLGAVAFWIVAFWLPERQRAPISPEMTEYLIALHRRVQYSRKRLDSIARPPL